MAFMPQIRISDAARLLGVSDDTVRRWVSTDALTASRDASGRMAIDGQELAAFSQALVAGETSRADAGGASSARNRFVGLVTAVKVDAVMAQVEMQCGPFRVVSLMSSEAVEELGLEPGSIAAAVIKSTNVIVESLE